jgi:D-beta-D-heptose 7-phosphate kinase/D-beta-D-heptose 1-phosphate adenosyltransferase
MKIFVNGSFDIIHEGHLDLLNYAKSLSPETYVLVAIDSDRRIAENKGPDRPFNNERNRKLLMENLKAVDEVQVFDTDKDLINIIKNFSPYAMVKGDDWQGGIIVGQDYIPRMIWYPRVKDESTTKTIQSYLNRR